MKIKILLALTVPCTCIQTGYAAVGIKKATSSYIIDQYTKTKYPTVFTHGMFGFNRLENAIFGID